MDEKILESYAITSKVVDAKTFMELDDNEKQALKTTKIIPPSKEYPFGAIELIYRRPHYIAHV